LDSLREHLIEARAGADLAAGRERRAGQQVAGLRAVDVPLARLFVEQPAHEQQALAERHQRRQHLAELHRGAFAARPPFLAVEAVAREQHREPHRRIGDDARRRRPRADARQRFEPGQRHRRAHAAQEPPPSEDRCRHESSQSSR
jgi:hypothetical protein